ncbi:MAG: glycosyltransferase family 2 protein [Candidatus Odyssella sp.]|nr:glycosyltransferase family 2 protein [Candidatus Odyssella sp.]
MSGEPEISVIVPVYNEEENVPLLLERLVPVLEKIGDYQILFALDPCTDGTEAVLRRAIAANPRIGYLRFSRRFGQPAATMAGILHCTGRYCAVIDADLQDPPEVIADLHAKAREGFDVVYATRRSRQGESWMKRKLSAAGYRLIGRISEVNIPLDTGDFRIMSRRVVEELRRLSESHGFLRGLVAFVGFPQAKIEYDRHERARGSGKYNRYLGSLKIAFNGIFGFSTTPLSLLLWTGIAICALSLLSIAAIVFTKFVIGQEYALGIPTIIVLISFIGGVQMASIGILGQYIGRIYDEVRRRPQYIVDVAENVPPRTPEADRKP